MSFERLAPHYTWMEALLAGPRLQRCRVTWLDALAGCEQILIAGVGHGHFLKACAQRFPRAQITSVDASAGMLQRARRRASSVVSAAERLHFVHATLPDWHAPTATFDAIVTPFFLDCFGPDELAEVIQTLSHAAKPKAVWLLSDFAVPPRGLARKRAVAVHAVMYAFFRRVTRLRAKRLTEPDAMLRSAGFELEGRKSSEWGLLHADLWARSSS